jgi:hypothetical protein
MEVPAEEVFAYFRTPADWVRLYGFSGRIEDCGAGCVARQAKLHDRALSRISL